MIVIMGSLDNACLTGFICRICCALKRVVIHAFSEEAEKIDLVCLMQDYLGVDVFLNDNLPKTVCMACAKKLRDHYEWEKLIKIAQATIKSREEARIRDQNKRKEAAAEERKQRVSVQKASISQNSTTDKSCAHCGRKNHAADSGVCKYRIEASRSEES